jgi:GNAT superfamily N-acetyltransferase
MTPDEACAASPKSPITPITACSSRRSAAASRADPVSLPRIFETALQAEIAGLIVDESARGAGLGRDLVAAAGVWARARGCRVIRVRSNVVRERARAFYEREGFVVLKTQRVFEKTFA